MMIKKFKKIVEEACKKESNHYGYRAWTHHIASVIKYATILVEKLNADREIVEIAAIFHDYASIVSKDLYPEHHIHSSKLAEDILRKHNYPEGKIEKIKHCIETHRGSKSLKRKTLEAKIVASADSMAHFSNVDSLFYLAYVVQERDVDDGRRFVLDKLERSWKKLMPEAKEIIREKHKAIKEALSKNAH